MQKYSITSLSHAFKFFFMSTEMFSVKCTEEPKVLRIAPSESMAPVVAGEQDHFNHFTPYV